jgi:hypothetical protein
VVDVFKKQVADAIESLARLDQIQVQEFTWPKAISLDWSQYKISIFHGSNEITGFGTDPVGDTALIKAFMESIERSYLTLGNSSLKTSNGLAAHFSKNLACSNALNEIIERDSFFCHFLTKTPFEYVSTLTFSSGVQTFLSALKKENVILHVRSMRSSFINRHCILIVAEKVEQQHRRGITMATACADSIQGAFDKALLEIAGPIFFKLQNPISDRNNKSISIDEWGPEEHASLLLNPDYWYWFKRQYLQTSENPIQNGIDISQNSEPHITFDQFEYSPPFIPNFSAHLAIAKSNELQPLYFGSTSTSHLNLERLEKFFRLHHSLKSKKFEIELMEHPFP